MSKRKTSRSAAIKRADLWFSRYVRKSAANKYGQAKCFTCGRSGDWKHEMQAGHFQSRAKYTTRWSEMNVKCQCVRCNISNGGQQYQFGINLDKRYGEGTAQSIVEESNKLSKYSTQEIIQIADEYRNKYNLIK